MGGLLSIDKNLKTFNSNFLILPVGDYDLNIASGLIILRVSTLTTNVCAYILDYYQSGAVIKGWGALGLLKTDDETKLLSLYYNTSTKTWHMINRTDSSVSVFYSIIKS